MVFRVGDQIRFREDRAKIHVMEILTLIGRLILIATTLVHFVYLMLFSISFNRLLYRFAEFNPLWLAAIRTVLHVAPSTGAVTAIFSITVFFRAKEHIFALSLLSAAWFVINLGVSFIIAPTCRTTTAITTTNRRSGGSLARIRLDMREG